MVFIVLSESEVDRTFDLLRICNRFFCCHFLSFEIIQLQNLPGFLALSLDLFLDRLALLVLEQTGFLAYLNDIFECKSILYTSSTPGHPEQWPLFLSHF